MDRETAFGTSLPPRYRVDGTLSHGERATTLDVFDTGLRQARAVLKIQRLSDDTEASTVEGEFRGYGARLAALQHDHVAAPYTFGTFSPETGGTFGYTTRPYVSGTPLSSFLLPLPDESVIVVALQVCQGLDALHAAGVVHCDLKPENVIVRRATSGRIDKLSQCVLIDFSYRSESTARALTEVTLQYVAPELFEGKVPHVRSDLYSVGVMLYRLLTGRFPFVGDSLPEVMRRQRARDCPSIASLRPRAPPGLCKVVERLLEPNPTNRPESAQALIALVEEFADSMAVPVRAALKHGAFVGREIELADCVVAIDMARPSAGVSSIEVWGAPGVGVTSFMRELQDRLESCGAIVLTAAPRAACGLTLQSQLREPVHAAARRPTAHVDVELPFSVPATSTDLLDDLLVAAQERRLVLFVDDWRRCDASERQFIQRLLLQDRVPIEGLAGRRGRCQVVLGDSSGSAEEVTYDLERVVARRVRLEGLDVQTTAQMLTRDGTLSSVHAGRLHAATSGNPKLIRALLARVAESPERADSALDAALTAAASMAVSELEKEVAALREAQDGLGLVALALWGEELPLGRWHAIASSLSSGPADATQAQFIERSGRTFIRSRHRHLADCVARYLGDDERASISAAVLAATWEDWRSHEPEQLIGLIRFVARLGTVPPRCRWRLCRALMLLLERGRFADVESATAALGRCDHVPWWVAVFRDAAQAGSSGSDQKTVPHAADLGAAAPASFFKSWIHARSLLRARYRQEALRILEALSTSTLPRAQPFGLAIAEDHALAAAESGCTDKVLSLRKSMLTRIRRWLPFVRRHRKNRNARYTHTRLRALRKVARYQRVRSRAHILKGRLTRALSACRKERLFNRADGNLLREASCLNNEALLLLKHNAATSSAAVLDRCVRLREALDDEQGLVIALTNLAAALSLTGDVSRVVSVLNRARIVATRNGLSRQRNFCMVNLAVAYKRRGQLRDAQRVLRHVRRFGVGDGDTDAKVRALHNGGLVSVDRWHMAVGEACASQLDRVIGIAAESARDTSGDVVRAEMAYRSRDWAHVHTLAARMRRKGVTGPQTAAYEARAAVEAGDATYRRAGRAEQRWPCGVRLRVVLLRRRGKRITLKSLIRVVAVARGHGAVREAAEWVVAHMEGASGSDESLDYGLKALSWLEFREGQDDLQIDLRAQLASTLRMRGRHAEAWRLVVDALVRFRRLERKLRRWPRGAHVLLYLQERLQLALTGAVGGQVARGQELSAALCVHAFDALLDFRRRSVGGQDQHAAAVVRLGAALGKGMDGAAFIDEVLAVAISATGAQRAILILGTSDSHKVDRVLLASGARADSASDISWAVVSQVLASGASSVFSDALTSEELASHRSVAVLQLRSLACVPLRAGSRVHGVLYLDHHGIAGLVGHEMLGFLELLAGVVALTLHVDGVEDQAGAARRELDEAHRHILRAERSRLAGELAGGLVHDLKNVLAAVSGRAQLLRRTSQDPQLLRSLDAIEKAAGAGAGLVQRLQECARDHSSQSEEPVDLVATAHESLELLAPKLERNRVTTAMHGAADAIAWGIPGEYREMFLNLFLNACDAMPDGGNLAVEFGCDREADRIRITVSDNGTGMSAETRARLFHPFYTTKGSAGTGLGLVVVRSVVVRRGGSIDVESSLGAGSRFILVFPAFSRMDA